ncbi:MAG: family 43 glycosylhydrolase [Trueperaceae bacterium]
MRRTRSLPPLLASLLTALLVLVLTGTALTQTGTYRNPIVTPTAADPSLLRAEDGRFYLVATQDSWDGRVEHFLPIFVSDDLIDWEFVGDAFALPPSWKDGGGFLWAPDLSFFEGRYYLYYAYSQWGDSNPCIGLATSEEPAGPWEDLGRPVFCSLDIGVRNSIDPFVWYEGGQRTLIWGSFHGIYAVELDEPGSSPAGEPVLLADGRFEAPYLIERDGFFYLFLSSGSCCEGATSTYLTWVGRSDSLLGPYVDAMGRDLRYGGGEVVLFRNDDWVGPGHNAVVQDEDGRDWIVYHAISPGEPLLRNGATRRPALIDPIDWEDAWPVVNDGEGPSSTEMEVPAVRRPGR